MARQGWLNRRIENAVRTQVRAAVSEAGDQYARSVKDTGAQYARSLKDTEDSAMRVVDRASRRAGRLMVVGGGSLGAALAAPVVAHHGLKSRRERRMAKSYDSLSDLAAVAKAWKGEPGDKRNTKYYLAGQSGGAAIGVGGYAALRNSDGMKRKRQARIAMRRMQGELQETSKAMTPNKIAGLRRAASRPAGSGMARSPFDASGMRRYAQARLGMAGVGQGIRNPSVPNLRQSLRSQASQYRPGVSLGAGVSNNGRPAARLP